MKVTKVPAELMLECIEAVAFGCDSFGKIVPFIREREHEKVSSGEKARLAVALNMAEQLNIIQKTKGSKAANASFAIQTDTKVDPRRWSAHEKKLFFRSRLQDFPPFLTFCELLSTGISSGSAARKTSTLFSIIPPLRGDYNVLFEWGQFSGILDIKSGKVIFKKEVKTFRPGKAFSGLEKSLDNKIGARLFLKKNIGEAYDHLEDSIKNDLVFALSECASDPDGALRKAGLALEDHLKNLAKKRSVGLVSKRGRPLNMIGQIINKLREEGVLANHHTTILHGLEVFMSSDVMQGMNAFRKMASHGKDEETGMRWSLGEEITTITIMSIMLAIRSTYHYAFKRKLVY